MAKRPGQKRNWNESVGYKCKFVDVPPSDIVCSLCNLVARDPRQMECCGKVFCKMCIERARNSSQLCPHCHKTGNCFIDHRGERQIKALKVQCNNEMSGCKWVGRLEELDTHLRYCEFEAVVCPNIGCSKMIARKDLEKHKEKDCLFTCYKCPDCGKIGHYKEMKVKHPEECPLMKTSCPNGCGNTTIMRRDVDAHRAMCPKEIINCSFSKLGCTARIMRDDVPKHLEQNIRYHLQLAMEENIRLKNELDLASKKMNDLQTRPLPVSFKLSDFSSLKESGGVWQSPSFYTNNGGYKMCLRVHANGFGTGNNTHISVSIHMMNGSYDDHLVWPFRGEVTVHLLNQISDENHHWCLLAFRDEKTRGYNNRAAANTVNKQGLGVDKFISHMDLNFRAELSRQYLKDNCLYFRISNIVLYPFVKPWLTQDIIPSSGNAIQ